MATEKSSIYVNPKHIGSSFDEFLAENLSEEEIKVLEAKAKLLGEIIDALKLTQKNLEALSGVKQPMIAKIENGNVNPSLDSLLRVLVSMGKTIKVVPI